MSSSINAQQTANLFKLVLAIALGGVAFVIELATQGQELGAAMYLLAVPLIWFIHNDSFRGFIGFVLSGLIIAGKIFSVGATDLMVWQQFLDRGAALVVIWLVVVISMIAERGRQIPVASNKPPRRIATEALEAVIPKGRGQANVTQAVFNSLPDPSIIFDFNGYIIAANPPASECFGHPEAAMKGQSITMLTSEVEPRGQSSLGDLLTRKDPTQISGQGRFTGRRSDGSTFPIYITVGEMPGGDEDIRLFVATLRDFSRLAVEEEQNLETRRTTARQRAGRLTASIIHDLRRSLAKAQTCLDLIGEQAGRNPGLDELLPPAMHAISEANNSSNKILQFGRARMLQPEEIDLNQLIRENLDELQVLAGGQAKIETDLVGRVWPIRADKGYLEEAIRNLVSNAAEGLVLGRGRIIIATDKIKIDAIESRKLRNLPAGDYAVLSVKDDGAGMESNVSAQAHMPYFTGAENSGRGGLGMSEIFDFVRRCGGYTDIHSEPDKGAMIRLLFPIAKIITHGDESKAQILGPVARKSRLSGVVNGNERLLYIDHDDEQRAAVAKLLNGAGYQVSQATSVQDAMKILHDTIDISTIISNEILDGQYNGLQAIAAAREIYQDLQAILISSGAMEVEVPKGITVVSKPFRRQDLLHPIRDQLRAQKT